MSETLNKSYVSVGEPLLPAGKMFFTIQPHNFTVTGPGQEVTFRGVAVGAFGYLWAWRPDPSAEWTVIDGEETDTFTTTVTAGMDGWQFICVALDAEDNYLESRIATITCKGLTEVSQEGAIVTIEQGPVELKSLVVNIEPVQEGSGDPSPDNIRPVSGSTQVDIFVAPTSDPDDPDKTTTTISLEQTVYGGSLEVDTGVLTVRMTSIVFDGSDDENWGNISIGATVNRASILISNATSGAYNNNLFGNYISAQSPVLSSPDEWKANINANKTLLIGIPTSITTTQDWKDFLSENNLVVVYELATPQTIELTPVEVSTLLSHWGENNIYASTGDVSVTYLDWPAAPEEIELNPQIQPISPLDIDPVLEPAIDDIQPIEFDTLL